MPEFFDLAITIRNQPMESAEVDVFQLDHATTARRLGRETGIPVDDLPLDGLYAAEERVEIGSHFGTHLDAPTHYGEVIGGRVAESVDRMALGPLFTDAVTLDFHDRGLQIIGVADIQAELQRISCELKPGDLVITRVGVEEHYLDDPGIRQQGAGMDAAAVNWLLDQGVRLSATDSMTADMPIPWMDERFRAGDRESYFPVHYVGSRRDYVHVEKAFGLRNLPGPAGYRVFALPIKLEGASGAWTRFAAVRGLPPALTNARLLDLSQPIRNESMESEVSTIKTHSAARRQRQWAKHLGVRVGEVEPRGAWDWLTTSTRAGTHMEAPYRFGPLTAGREAMTIDQVPLDWCFGRGVVLDISTGQPTAPIEVDEIKAELARIGHTLSAGDIVILNTGAADRFDGDPSFPATGRGLTRESLIWLIEQGVRVIGSDAESLDQPLPAMLDRARGGDSAALFPVHLAAREFEHCQILKLGHLDELPQPTGFYVWAPPIKIESAGSGWVRAVALLPT